MSDRPELAKHKSARLGKLTICKTSLPRLCFLAGIFVSTIYV